MKCTSCGRENEEHQTYCRYCGEKLNKKLYPTNIENNDTNSNNNSESFSMYCQCGQKLEKDWKYCPKCNTPITVSIVTDSSTRDNDDELQVNPLIFILIYLISNASFYLFRFSWGTWIALFTIVAGRIYCPKSKIIKVFFWLTMIQYVLMIATFMWLMIACSAIVSN